MRLLLAACASLAALLPSSTSTEELPAIPDDEVCGTGDHDCALSMIQRRGSIHHTQASGSFNQAAAGDTVRAHAGASGRLPILGAYPPSSQPDTVADLLLSQLTWDEKVGFLHGQCNDCEYVGMAQGVPRLGIPPLHLHDGPQGVRTYQWYAGKTSTCWPGGMAMAATWDADAVHAWGKAMAQEFKGKGANVLLGPGVNVARVPVNGRNFEYLSGEDPHLGYVLAGAVTKGIQGEGVVACAKHWVGNSQEQNRSEVSEDIDERTLFEVYYLPFLGAVEAGVGSVMCSYNRVNGVYSCENAVSLGHLKKELGFKGFVMSDWWATHSTSLRQGLDMEMPDSKYMSPSALRRQQGNVRSSDLDEAVRRTLRAMVAVGLLDPYFKGDLGAWDRGQFKSNVSTEEHIALARRLSTESTVLLKNEGAVLPLERGRRLALIGFAAENGKALACGHGSGEVEPSYYVSPLQGIRRAAGAGAEVHYNSGEDIDAAAALARSADYAIVFVGASASEGGDRAGLSLDGACRYTELLNASKEVLCEGQNAEQNRLVAAVAAANAKSIVVASVPGAFLLPWIHEVKAALVNFMPGQEVGHAIADVLFGDVNPSAKLPITLPNSEEELAFPPSQYPGTLGADGLPHSNYSEGLFVGYRAYEARSIAFDKGFPFGHGLSYSAWHYAELQVSGRNVSFKVKNAGPRAGRETAQLYLSFPEGAGEPPLQLKAFSKTRLLAPGGTATVQMSLAQRDVSVWDPQVHAWRPVPGRFALHVGSSSRDIRLRGELSL